jgi:hypothetical protein
VAYAAATDPHSWANKVPDTPPHFAEFQSEFRDHGFDLADLDDGGAIANYDAVLAAVTAIRLAVPPARGVGVDGRSARPWLTPWQLVCAKSDTTSPRRGTGPLSPAVVRASTAHHIGWTLQVFGLGWGLPTAAHATSSMVRGGP